MKSIKIGQILLNLAEIFLKITKLGKTCRILAIIIQFDNKYQNFVKFAKIRTLFIYIHFLYIEACFLKLL